MWSHRHEGYFIDRPSETARYEVSAPNWEFLGTATSLDAAKDKIRRHLQGKPIKIIQKRH